MTQDARVVEAMARAIYEDRNGHGCKPWAHIGNAHQSPYRRDAHAALTALLTSRPDLAAVLDGSAVVVPREATRETLDMGVMTLTMPWSSVIPPGEDPDVYIMAMVWTAMLDIASSPFARAEDTDHE